MATTKSLFYLRFEDVPEEHVELLQLSLSTPYSSSFAHQQTKKLIPCEPNPRKRLLPDSFDDEDEETQGLDLSLSIRPPGPPSSPAAVLLPASPPPQAPAVVVLPDYAPPPHHQEAAGSGLSCSYHQPVRVRRKPTQAPKKGKIETIAPPYPWATNRRATVHSLEYLKNRGVSMISGELECKNCQETVKIEYDLEEKFRKIADFITENKYGMHQRAPEIWMSPKLDTCRVCGMDLKPVFNKKRDINWLFLLLGNMIGCCKHVELKYFCKHTSNHRTGAKDRLLYLTYLELCKQLDPNGPFEV